MDARITPAVGSAAGPGGRSDRSRCNRARNELSRCGSRSPAPPKRPPAAAQATPDAARATRALVGRTVADVERDLILETLAHCRGNRTHAADILGISIRTLRNKLNAYAGDGVPVPQSGSTGRSGRDGVLSGSVLV